MTDKSRAGKAIKDNARSGELAKRGQRRNKKAGRAGRTSRVGERPRKNHPKQEQKHKSRPKEGQRGDAGEGATVMGLQSVEEPAQKQLSRNHKTLTPVSPLPPCCLTKGTEHKMRAVRGLETRKKGGQERS